MTTVFVCDASAIVALFIDVGDSGSWVARSLESASLAAPHLMPYECANIIRRQELATTISSDQASLAIADLSTLPVELWPYEATATRAWSLRHNLSAYDSSYVALAESLGATLITLDRRMAQAPGIRCDVAMPPTDTL